VWRGSLCAILPFGKWEKIRTQANLVESFRTTKTKSSRIILCGVCRVEYEVLLQIESILMLIPTQIPFYKKWS